MNKLPAPAFYFKSATEPVVPIMHGNPSAITITKRENIRIVQAHRSG